MLMECRKFHDQTFVKRHPKRCCQMITNLLVLLTRGERFSSTEVTDVFFGVTKLFESEDVRYLPTLLAQCWAWGSLVAWFSRHCIVGRDGWCRATSGVWCICS